MPDETIDHYVTQLRTLASSCEYFSLEESIIRDVLVSGINDYKLRESMLREINLFLERAIHMARAAEQAKT